MQLAAFAYLHFELPLLSAAPPSANGLSVYPIA